MKEVAVLFEKGGLDDPAREAEILITGVLDIDRAELYSGDALVAPELSEHISSLAERRMMGEPIQYLVGHAEFYGLQIYVGRGVLIPRPETELLVEETIKTVKRRVSSAERQKNQSGPAIAILDLCTGSGCIALALASHFPEAVVYGVDSSEAALVYATQNALANNIRNIRFLLGDLFEAVRDMNFDCIVSNPPYIRHDEIKTLQREVRDYEPVEALDGGKDGLDFYRRIFRSAPSHMTKDGTVMLEIGYNQAAEIRELATRSGFMQPKFIKDFADIERVAVLERSWN